MPQKTLAEAIVDQPPPPCDDPCPHRMQCARKQMACEDYYCYYAAGARVTWEGGARLPGREWFNYIHSEDGHARNTMDARIDSLREAGVTPRVLENVAHSGTVEALVQTLGCSHRDVELVARRWGVVLKG